MILLYFLYLKKEKQSHSKALVVLSLPSVLLVFFWGGNPAA